MTTPRTYSPPPTPPSSNHSPLYPSSPSLTSTSPQLNALPSDLPTVRRQHTTDGYRAGLDAGKSDPVIAQAGFDQGYPLGIGLGMRAGFLLGALAELRRWNAGGVDEEVVKRAEEDLKVEKLVVEVGGRLGKGVLEEMEGAEDGMLESEGEAWQDVDDGWIGTLPAVRRWTEFVADAGARLGIDLSCGGYSREATTSEVTQGTSKVAT